jgi:hypothetical protein
MEKETMVISGSTKKNLFLGICLMPWRCCPLVPMIGEFSDLGTGSSLFDRMYKELGSGL